MKWEQIPSKPQNQEHLHMAGAKSAAKTPTLGSTGAIFYLIALYSMFLISPGPSGLFHCLLL